MSIRATGFIVSSLTVVQNVHSTLKVQMSRGAKTLRTRSCHIGSPPSEETPVRLAVHLGLDPDVTLALAGKVSSDLREVIRKCPQLFGQLIRELKNMPDSAVLRLPRLAMFSCLAPHQDGARSSTRRPKSWVLPCRSSVADHFAE
jgi:hypothetical protein